MVILGAEAVDKPRSLRQSNVGGNLKRQQHDGEADNRII
jgi:hypothetical protein